MTMVDLEWSEKLGLSYKNGWSKVVTNKMQERVRIDRNGTMFNVSVTVTIDFTRPTLK